MRTLLFLLLFTVAANAQTILYDVKAPVDGSPGDSMRVISTVNDTNDTLLVQFGYVRNDTNIYFGALTLYDAGGDSTGVALSVIRQYPLFDWRAEAMRQGVTWKDLLTLMKVIRFIN